MARQASIIASVKAVLPPKVIQPEARSSYAYLYGLRGILVIESFLWSFFQTFIPAIVTNEAPGPLYQVVIRKTFSVLFWNASLISSFYIVLSGRAVCVHFLNDPSSQSFARSLISRPLRIGIPLALALAFSISIFSTIDTDYIEAAAQTLQNPTLSAPKSPSTALAAFNSIWDLLWVVRDFGKQQGNQAFPGSTLWVPSLIYSQSYTVYIAMVILPFTRPAWHVQAIALFSLGSFWFDSWGWYSAAGLFIADIASNSVLNNHLKQGLNLRGDFAIPFWIPAALSLVIGLALKYIWTAAFPEHARAELVIHPSIHLTEGVSVQNFNDGQAYARLDDYLIIVGVLVLIELLESLRKILSARLLVELGKRSLSIFVAQSLVLYAVGLKIFVILHDTHDLSVAAANTVVFVAYVALTIAFGEMFYWVVDRPAQKIASVFFDWSRA